MVYLRKIKIPILIIFAKNDRFLTEPLEYYVMKLTKELKTNYYKIKLLEDSSHSFTGKWKEIFKEILRL
jgi:esterase/lipase